MSPVSTPWPSTRVIGRFYDFARWLYPMIDPFFTTGRRRLVQRINLCPAGELLEIGTGPGTHLPLYRGHRVTGIDVSAGMIRQSQAACPGATLIQMDGEALEFPDARFDLVVLAHVLSVTADPNRLLSEVRRVLRPGGLVFIVTHETPTHALRHWDRLITPLARWFKVRSWFRLREWAAVEPFTVLDASLSGPLGVFLTVILKK
jgi:phosphatidylethanolamine/phosphatidyl-N-methylethanolamine N-methyltransferase